LYDTLKAGSTASTMLLIPPHYQIRANFDIYINGTWNNKNIITRIDNQILIISTTGIEWKQKENGNCHIKIFNFTIWHTQNTVSVLITSDL